MFIHDRTEWLDEGIGAPCYPVCADTNVDSVKIHRLQLCVLSTCDVHLTYVEMLPWLQMFGVVDEDRNDYLSTSNTFVTDISEIMQADTCYWSS